MDATVKPLRIPPEMAVYAEKHEIFDLIQTLMRNLIVDKPRDPIQYLIGLLKRENIEVPRVMLLGPPASGKRTLAKKLCECIGAIHVTASDILKDDTDLTRAAQKYREENQEVPQDLWIKLIQQRLWRSDCVRRGWVLEAIPKNRGEALCLQEAGISPEHVVILQAPDNVLIERSLGKRIDPVTGDVYHVTFIWPDSPEVTQRLEKPQGPMTKDHIAQKLRAYHKQACGLQTTYHSRLRVIDADQPHVDVFAQARDYVLTRSRSDAPHTPRIVLLGPPGCGKSLQARLLAHKYSVVDVCCGELLKAVAADDSSMGELIKPFLESGRQVPDLMVRQILTERLSRLDCTTRGWVLHGFPRNVDQAAELQEAGFGPSRVFFLEMSDDVGIARLALRSVDPATGERYHLLLNPAPNEEVQARLWYDPQDSEEELHKRMKDYWDQVAGLQTFYPQAVRVNADQDPHTVFECLESRLVGRLPKVLPDSP
ncbi:adenylate kinase 8 [Brachyhypopomus gauderio]|uniref:adenylate kinase 8 n=1 Tax=Brachyhypopomus gauderio TaxID=698409 RepID=UPI0040411217